MTLTDPAFWLRLAADLGITLAVAAAIAAAVLMLIYLVRLLVAGIRKLAAWLADAGPYAAKHALAVLTGAIALGVATAMNWIEPAVAYIVWFITTYVGPVLGALGVT